MVKTNFCTKIVGLATAIGFLMAASLFADHGTELGMASQTVSVPQPKKQQTIRAKEEVQKTKLVRVVSPLYPPALGKRVDGTVILHVIVTKSGAVRTARYISGPANLATSAIDAVRQWRYKPTLINGMPVDVDTTVSVVFPPLSEETRPPRTATN